MRCRFAAPVVSFAMVIGLLCVTGCQKLSSEAKALLAANATMSKERAAAFLLVQDKLKAAAPDDQALIKRWGDAHAKGLSAQAAGLNALLKAVETGSSLSNNAIQALQEEAATSRARVENLALVVKKLALDHDLSEFLSAHQEALLAQTQALEKLAELVAKKGGAK